MDLKLYSAVKATKSPLYFLILFFLISCSSKEDSAPKATAPSNLAYSPATLELKTGVAGSSVKPTVAGTMPISYSLSTNPNSNGAITIESDGIIKATTALAIGDYNISVTATNSAGSVAFNNVYKIQVKDNPVLVSALTYSPNSLSFETGEVKSSSVPTIAGTKPVTFAVSSTPASQYITVDNTGKITAGKDISAGTYTLSLTATNAAGAAEFKTVYTITATAPKGPTALAYSPNLLTLVEGTAGTSTTPTVTGAGTITYMVSSSPATSEITINNQGIIAVTANLPVGTYILAVTAANAEGNKAFANAYSVKVETSNPTTFNNEVKAIIQNNCASCHTTGAQSKYNQYANAKAGIDAILDRIQRAQGSAGMMPQGGTKLSADLINTIKKWKDDGLKE